MLRFYDKVCQMIYTHLFTRLNSVMIKSLKIKRIVYLTRRTGILRLLLLLSLKSQYRSISNSAVNNQTSFLRAVYECTNITKH